MNDGRTPDEEAFVTALCAQRAGVALRISEQFQTKTVPITMVYAAECLTSPEL